MVVGGQFGGEGKGKMTAYLCRTYNFDAVVRCGGPNSGHTITIDNKSIVLRAYPKNIKTKIPIVKRDENGYRKRLSDTGRALGKD